MLFSERLTKFFYPLRELLYSRGRCDLLPYGLEGEEAIARIVSLLSADKPCMIGRFGSTELAGMLSVRDIESSLPVYLKYWKVLRGDMRAADKWNQRIRRHMADWSGFYPLTDEVLVRFCRLMERDAAELDVLGSWLPEERRVAEFSPKCVRIPIDIILRPDKQVTPWTHALTGKKVLVIHPFAETIRRQYEKRQYLFNDKVVLPDCQLKVFQAVQSLRGENSRFSTWFDALEWMRGEIDQLDFEVALIGAGAYGFPLAAHIKRSGRKAVHVGGALQLMFGIKGRRWKNDPYLLSVMNEYWVCPSPDETPRNLHSIAEGGCYW